MPEAVAERMFELLAISREIASATDHAVLPHRIVEHTARFLGADTAVLLLSDEQGRATIAAAVGLPEGAGNFDAVLDEGIGAKLCRALDCDPGRLLAAPVIESGRVQGILTVLPRERAGRIEAKLLSGLADQAAVALENTRHLQRLERALDLLREADQRKDDFLSILSHEIRNPLAPIRASIYILDHTDSKSEAAAHARLVLKRQTDQLTRLIDDLLDVTRIARGRIAISREPVDIVEVAHRAADDHRSMMQAHGLKLSLQLDVPLHQVYIKGDPTRLAQVVGNLLQNAAKFTPAGGEVYLHVVASDSHTEVRVRDTGRGIDPILADRIFEPFVQAEQPMSRSHGGLGLGLALVRGIVHLHEGTVRVVSEGKDRGSEFIVSLPLASDTNARAVNNNAAALSVQPKRVLVVDDNRDAADSLADIVRLLGHTVDVAYEGSVALARVFADPPDAVLCDLGLPHMTGYEFARAVRKTSAHAVRLIAVSGYAQPEDIRKSLEAGFEAHLAKPADPMEIERLLA
jgi:signal transduction histidine kinase